LNSFPGEEKIYWCCTTLILLMASAMAQKIVVTKMQSQMIEIRFLTGEFMRKKAFVPRLSLNP